MASVTTDQRQGVNASQAIKVPCIAATTSNITLSGEQTIDGVSVTSGDRVLVKDQTDGTENGIYKVDTGNWSRSKDWNGNFDVVTGTSVYAYSGSVNKGYWEVTTTGTITPGTTSIAFSQGVPGGSNDSSIIVNKTSFANSSLSNTGNATVHDFNQSRPIYLDVDYGATLDGSTVVTTELQAAIDDIGAGGGWLVINGPIKTGAITFPTYTSWMRIDVYGTWTTTATIEVDNYMHINGTGGSSGAQFQSSGAAATITTSGTVSPVVNVTGASKSKLSNLFIQSQSSGGIGLRLDGSSANCALISMDNVIVHAHNSANSIACQMDAVFWVFAKRCVFATFTNGDYSLDLTHSVGASGSGPGLLFFDETIVSGHGINIDTDEAANPIGNIYFKNLDFENGIGYHFTIDGTNTRVGNIVIDRMTSNDNISTTDWFNITAPSLGDVRDIKLLNTHVKSDIKTFVGDAILNLQVNTGELSPSDSGWSIGDNQHYWAGTMYNKHWGESEVRGHMFSPIILPVTPENVIQDLSDAGWNKGTVTVTTGIVAPDGTTNAYKLSVASGTDRIYDDYAITAADGDFVVGLWWTKPEDTDEPPDNNSLISLIGGSLTFAETGTANISPDQGATSLQNSSWLLQTCFGTISGSGATSIRLALSCNVSRATSYFAPTVLRLPASSFTAQEAHRIRKFLSSMPPNVTSSGDVVSVLDHHKFRFGNGPRVWGGTAAPGSGTYEVGDTVINTAPSADGNNMIEHGWRCTVAGSPGTWVSMYVSTVSPAT